MSNIQTTRTGTVRQMIEGYREQFAKALPKHLSPDRYVRCVLTAITRTPKLADCDQASLFQALLKLSQLGLEPDGWRAHLIPFENRKRGVTECQLIIDYKGLAELVMRSGIVSNLHCDVVCENDEFDYDRGELKRHRIDFRKPRGSVFAVYALCRFKDGSEKCDVMSSQEIEAIRSRSKAGQSGPWVSDWNEMAKKTVFRRLSKLLPISPEYRDAIEADDDDVRPGKTVQVVSTTTSMAPSVEIAMPNVAAALPEPISVDEAAEAEAGLAPVKAPPVSAPADASDDSQTPQERLAKLVTEAGYTFSHLQQWAAATGNIPDADSMASFSEVPKDVATRLFRSTRGLLAGLAKLKAEAA